jgi:hypothetical protein
MGEWTRSTPWRQGSILAREVTEIVETATSVASGSPSLAIVISHDCDIAADPSIEPNIEVIWCSLIKKENGSLTHAKNPRRLHLALRETISHSRVFIEIRSAHKSFIAKPILAGHKPSSAYALEPADREILQRWLAARYRRHAFPDEFEAAFKKVD